ncbi:MAG TPA: TylF/MycF/NovP-related O-methyltransferase, partial [Magnetospirillum sp.]|nr:TylF/MycF/NovP-related O-methyltransferase [Magnetospirillum sp.]
MEWKKQFQRVVGSFGYAVVRTETLEKMLGNAAPERAGPKSSPADGLPLRADDGREYGVIVRGDEPTTTVPQATLNTLLRESLLLRRQAAEIADLKRHIQALQDGTVAKAIQAEAQTRTEGTFYTPIYNYDGLRTDPRIIHNHDFMRDPTFVAAYSRALKAAGVEQNYYWRVHVALWCANHARHLEGDFVECGVWRGLLSSAIMQHLDWNNFGRHFYLFDTFRGIDETQLSDVEILKGNTAHLRHHYQNDIYEDVVENFSEFNNHTIVRGSVPSTLDTVKIDKISYLSIDMNNAAPEIACADYFWDKLVPGATILLDDYGFVTYEEQKQAFDNWSKKYNIPILALPTG